MPYNHLILCRPLLLPSSIFPSISSVQSLSCVRLFATPWTTACQASLSITNFPSTRVFSNESALRIRWPKYWSFSFSISPSNEYSGLISFRMYWLYLLAVQGTLKSLLQHHSSKASEKHFYLFTYLWLCWVVTVACRLSLFAVTRTGDGEEWVDGNSLLPSSHCGGFSCCRTQALGLWASVVAHGQVAAPWHAESSQSRNQTHFHCIGRWFPIHCALKFVF